MTIGNVLKETINIIRNVEIECWASCELEILALTSLLKDVVPLSFSRKVTFIIINNQCKHGSYKYLFDILHTPELISPYTIILVDKTYPLMITLAQRTGLTLISGKCRPEVLKARLRSVFKEINLFRFAKFAPLKCNLLSNIEFYTLKTFLETGSLP